MSNPQSEAFREALSGGREDEAQAIAERLWTDDRDAFFALLQETVADQGGELLPGVVLLRALRSDPEHSARELTRVFGVVVQRQQMVRPSPLSRELYALARELRALFNQGQEEAHHPGSLALSLANAQLHFTHWRVQYGEDPAEGLREVDDLLRLATSCELRAVDHYHLAVLLGNRARMSGDAQWLPDARQSMTAAIVAFPQLSLLWTTVVLRGFAHATGSRDLWEEIVEVAESRVDKEPERALYPGSFITLRREGVEARSPRPWHARRPEEGVSGHIDEGSSSTRPGRPWIGGRSRFVMKDPGYQLAMARAHLGQRGEALLLLHRSAQAAGEAALAAAIKDNADEEERTERTHAAILQRLSYAARDPDMRALFDGAGSVSYSLVIPPGAH